MEDLESHVNDLLLSNGWDYEDRKRVLFMLRNKKPALGTTVERREKRSLISSERDGADR